MKFILQATVNKTNEIIFLQFQIRQTKIILHTIVDAAVVLGRLCLMLWSKLLNIGLNFRGYWYAHITEKSNCKAPG